MKERSDVTGLFVSDFERLAGGVHVFDRGGDGAVGREIRQSEVLTMEYSAFEWLRSVGDESDFSDRCCHGCGIDYDEFARLGSASSSKWFVTEFGVACGDCLRSCVG